MPLAVVSCTFLGLGTILYYDGSHVHILYRYTITVYRQLLLVYGSYVHVDVVLKGSCSIHVGNCYIVHVG